MIAIPSVAQEIFRDASYDDVRKGLKRIAEFDFANPKILDTNATNLMYVLVAAYKRHPSWASHITDVQYQLMFPRRRSEIARAICAGGGGCECVLQVFETLIKAALIRSQMMGR